MSGLMLAAESFLLSVCVCVCHGFVKGCAGFVNGEGEEGTSICFSSLSCCAQSWLQNLKANLVITHFGLFGRMLRRCQACLLLRCFFFLGDSLCFCAVLPSRSPVGR